MSREFQILQVLSRLFEKHILYKKSLSRRSLWQWSTIHDNVHRFNYVVFYTTAIAQNLHHPSHRLLLSIFLLEQIWQSIGNSALLTTPRSNAIFVWRICRTVAILIRTFPSSRTSSFGQVLADAIKIYHFHFLLHFLSAFSTFSFPVFIYRINVGFSSKNRRSKNK